MKRSISRAAFLLSTFVIVFLFGWGARFFGWFPDAILYDAARQAHRIIADPPPPFAGERVYRRQGARTLRQEEVQPGLTLIASRWEDAGWRSEVRLVDRRGTALHRWVVDPGRLFPESSNRRRAWGEVRHRGMHGTRLLPNGDLLVNFNYVGTARLDACGKVIWTLADGNHHAISPADDGTFWIPGATGIVEPVSPSYPDGYPGIDRDVHHDLLLRVDEDGAVVDSLRVFDLLYENGLERIVARSGMDRGPDLTHLNDVEPLPTEYAGSFPEFEAGDLLVSLRYPDLVFVVDPATGRIKWFESQLFIEQHDPDFLPNGWIGVFDNNLDGTGRGSMLGGSRIVAIQPHTDSVQVLFPTDLSDSIYTTIMGNWQFLPNGNLLIAESRAGRVLEVNPDGRTVWDWVQPAYGEDRVPQISEALRYDLSPADLSSWSCSGRVRAHVDSLAA